jgi:hypothetical protein
MPSPQLLSQRERGFRRDKFQISNSPSPFGSMTRREKGTGDEGKVV